MTASTPTWETYSSRLRHRLAEHGADFAGQAAWLALLAALLTGVPRVAWQAAIRRVAAVDVAVLLAAAVLAVAGWTVLTVLHEATHAVALTSRGVRADVTVNWWRVRGRRLPIANSGVCRPRGDGAARLTPTEHIRVATAPAAIAAALTAPAVIGGVAAGASPVIVAAVVAGIWLFGGPSPSDWGRVIEVLLWPDEYRSQAQQLARRLSEHAAAEGLASTGGRYAT
ncbi:hypothetical protein [Halobaculum sp. D14]|uniref:hypothetical protein n=1 Tax=Halobaculum sp. D14 TaxID=3421642 RepID=UPI003EB98F0C